MPGESNESINRIRKTLATEARITSSCDIEFIAYHLQTHEMLTNWLAEKTELAEGTCANISRFFKYPLDVQLRAALPNSPPEQIEEAVTMLALADVWSTLADVWSTWDMHLMTQGLRTQERLTCWIGEETGLVPEVCFRAARFFGGQVFAAKLGVSLPDRLAESSNAIMEALAKADMKSMWDVRMRAEELQTSEDFWNWLEERTGLSKHTCGCIALTFSNRSEPLGW